jgi:hypothetical protein
MMTTLKRIILSSIFLIISHLVFAQEGGKQYQLVLKSNDTLTVNLTDTDETSITVFNIKTGRKARISKQSIVSFQPLDKVGKRLIKENEPIEQIEKLQKEFKKEVIVVKDNDDEDTEYARVITKNNDTVVVKIVSRDKVNLTVYNLKTQQNSRIALGDISSIERVEKEKSIIKKVVGKDIITVPTDGKYYRYSTRNNATPTAFPLKAGEGYFHNMWIFYNNVHVGITDHLSIGLGVFIFPGVFGDEGLPIGGHLKYAGKVADKWHLGVDVLVANFPGSGSPRTTLMGVATYGDRRNNLSLGVGILRYKNFFTTEKIPYITVAGQVQMMDNFFFVGDMGLGTNVDGRNEIGLIINPGVRFKFKKMSLDVSFARLGGDGDGLFIPIPIIGFTANFGKKRD